MSESEYAKGITTEDLRTLLEFWPLLMAEGESTRQDMQIDKDKFLTEDAAPFSWCYLYELPIKEHLTLALSSIQQNFSEFLSEDQVVEWLTQLTNAPGQISEIPKLYDRVGEYFDAAPDPTKEQAQKLRPTQASTFGAGWSMFNTLRCILYHGCFLNELLERIRSGDDSALFSAVRMDATVIGCPSVVQRISKATILNEEKFFKKLKNSINGKQTKREQANFQMMRLVLEVLHEAGASKLNDKQLQKLFIKELKLYSRDADPKALQKFANTYMKKKATT